MNNTDFEKLEYNEGFGYEGEMSIDFFGKDVNVDLTVNVDDEEIVDLQYETYEKFKEKWNDLQKEIAEKIQNFFPDTDLSMLESSIQRYKDIDAWNETPVLKQEAFEKLQTVMQEAGELTTKAPYETIVNNEFAKKAIK